MMFRKLNLPSCSFKINTDEGTQSSKIFDIIRKRYVALTAEEWVRQHLIHYLVNEKSVPGGLLAIEKSLRVNNLLRRTDIVVYSGSLKPVLLVECKAPDVKITQKVFDQAARYNFTLDVKYFVLSNGMQTICCLIDHDRQQYEFLKEIPSYKDLKSREE